MAPQDYQAHYDPYDIWVLPTLGKAKASAFSSPLGFAITSSIALADTIAPDRIRGLLGVTKHRFPTTLAMIVSSADEFSDAMAANVLKEFKSSAAPTNQYQAWGLPFAWYSKNGVYPPGTPYITYTPYVMKALLRLGATRVADEAINIFHQTWPFLESLQVMYENADELALSYSPLSEPRIVVNANSYAVWAYSMHAVHGLPKRRALAEEKAKKISRWITNRQRDDGSWLYYDDKLPGNFIDCFHSCFIVRNLRDSSMLVPELLSAVSATIETGTRYIMDTFPDKYSGLVRRFAFRDTTFDQFKFDLYDQAEYLGILVENQKFSEARSLVDSVNRYFVKNGKWHCRIDYLGRPWGPEFLRWGIVPFWQNERRLALAQKRT